MLSVALAALVVIMMISIGLEIAPANLRQSLAKWKWLLAAVVLNILIFPFITWLAIETVAAPVGLAAGFLLCAAAPGGPVGPVLSRLANSDLPFATGLMVVLGILGLATTPLTASILIEGNDGSVFWPMFAALLLFQIAPLVAAMAVRKFAPSVAASLAKPMRLLSNVLLVVIVVALVATRGEVLVGVSLATHVVLVGGLLVLLVPVLLMARPNSIARGLLIVTGVRNMSVALLLANRFFTEPDVEAAILLWSFWMLLLPAVVGFAAGRFRMIEIDQPVSGVPAVKEMLVDGPSPGESAA